MDVRLLYAEVLILISSLGYSAFALLLPVSVLALLRRRPDNRQLVRIWTWGALGVALFELSAVYQL